MLIYKVQRFDSLNQRRQYHERSESPIDYPCSVGVRPTIKVIYSQPDCFQHVMSKDMAFAFERFVRATFNLISVVANFQVHSIVHSRIFEFVVGHEKHSFKIHSSAVAEQSDALNNLINGTMIEAQVGRVVWEDLSVKTFVRFIQFAYLGDYPTPASIPMMGLNGAVTLAAPAAPVFTFQSSITPAETKVLNHFGTMKSPFEDQTSTTKAEKMPAKTIEEHTFKNLNYPARVPAVDFFKSCKPRSNRANDDFTPVFIAHAELYIFAEKYGIKILKQTTLHKLHKTLAIYTINPDNIGAIVELIRYTFSEDNTLAQENHVDDLRELVFAYVTSQLKVIRECEQFLALLEEGGAFVKRVWLTLIKQMS